MKKNIFNKKPYIILISSAILSLLSFFLTYYLDILNYKNVPLAAIPSFLLSIIILIIGQIITIHNEVEKTAEKSEQVCETVRNYLHVTKMGTPQSAWNYIINRLPVLEYVQNTSFNFADENDTSDERFYDTQIYQKSIDIIAKYINKGLKWKDLGDPLSLDRFKKIDKLISNKSIGQYNYKFISQSEPQIGFIILTYIDGTKEVLFNWDFRDIPQDPEVLLSRDQEIFNMFAAQYKGLWREAVCDYDNIATKSTSKK